MIAKRIMVTDNTSLNISGCIALGFVFGC